MLCLILGLRDSKKVPWEQRACQYCSSFFRLISFYTLQNVNKSVHLENFKLLRHLLMFGEILYWISC